MVPKILSFFLLEIVAPETVSYGNLDLFRGPRPDFSYQIDQFVSCNGNCQCEHKCSTCEQCLAFIVDTSCDTKNEIQIMERFLEQFFETLYDKESFKNDRIGIIQNDGKRSYIPISPADEMVTSNPKLLQEDIMKTISELKLLAGFDLGQSIQTAKEVFQQVPKGCKNEQIIVITNGGTTSDYSVSELETFKSEKIFVLTTNNETCKNDLKEDCWTEDLVLPIIKSRRYLLQLQSSQHRQYVTDLFTDKDLQCIEVCADECNCPCETNVTKCAVETESGLPCCGPRGPPGPDGPHGIRGQQGPTGHAGTLGLKGFLGYRGAQGPPGPKGITGYSNTFVGITGQDGAKGPRGEDGETGQKGYSGYDGQMGPTGYPGDIGDSGKPLKGFQGQKGTKGPEGDQGVLGDPGVQGTSFGHIDYNTAYKKLVKKAILDSLYDKSKAHLLKKFMEIAKEQMKTVCSCSCELETDTCEAHYNISPIAAENQSEQICIDNDTIKDPKVHSIIVKKPLKERMISFTNKNFRRKRRRMSRKRLNKLRLEKLKLH